MEPSIIRIFSLALVTILRLYSPRRVGPCKTICCQLISDRFNFISRCNGRYVCFSSAHWRCVRAARRDAFIPGISGQLFRHFAVAVSVSMLISALNALTLSPALCSLLIRRGHASRGPMRYVLGGIDRVRDGYASIVSRHCSRRGGWGSSSRSASWRLRRSSCCGKRHRAFCRRRIRARCSPPCVLLEGASINRTEGASRRAGRKASSGALAGVEKASCRWSDLDFIDGFAASNQAFFVIRLKPYEDRTDPRREPPRLSLSFARNWRRSSRRSCFRSTCRPFSASGTRADPQYVLEGLQSQLPAEIAETMRGLLVAANQQPELAGVFSTFAADTPQVRLDIDRNKAQALGVKIADLFNTRAVDHRLAFISITSMFSVEPGKSMSRPTRRIETRRDRQHLRRLRAQWSRRDGAGAQALAQPEIIQGPQLLTRYNGYRAALINGAPKFGFSSGQALNAMERISATTLPTGYAFEWTGTALQEKAAAGGASLVLGLAVLFAYLLLRGSLRVAGTFPFRFCCRSASAFWAA